MVQFKLEDGILTCSFSGRLDTESCLKDEKEISDNIKSTVSTIMFDLGDTEYIASAFLRICIKTSKQIGKDNFSIVNVCPNVKKVLKISGFDKILNIN